MHGDMTTWLTWFFILNALDVVLTLYVIRNGGRELNPILAKWFSLESPDVVLIRVKVALLIFVWLAHYFGALPAWALMALVAGYAGLAVWNLRSAYRTWKRLHP